jgi:DNA sulfur modification protein DndB
MSEAPGALPRNLQETKDRKVLPPFEYVFPAIRGIQAGREYFISMCPLRLLPKIFLFDEEELVPELRAQRVLNRARLPELTRYVIDNPTSYVFSAITASVDGDLKFEPMGTSSHGDRVGALHISMSARFIINDGQHRRAAIEVALKERPELADESIAVVFFQDAGLQRCQQMFADLNRHAVRPSKSVGVLYDHRDDRAIVARLVVTKSKMFRDVVELERSTLSARSRKLFTLSAIYGATSSLLHGVKLSDTDAKVQLAVGFWEAVATRIPEWQAVMARKVSAAEVRRDFIHSHGIVLHAVGRAGNALLRANGADTRTLSKRLQPLEKIDWSRSNSKLWEGRAMIGGRISKAEQNVVLTTNVLKKHLGVALSAEEQRTEEAFLRGA